MSHLIGISSSPGTCTQCRVRVRVRGRARVRARVRVRVRVREVPTELLQVRHESSLLNGAPQPLLVADFCRSMTPLTQHVYVLVP